MCGTNVGISAGSYRLLNIWRFSSWVLGLLWSKSPPMMTRSGFSPSARTKAVPGPGESLGPAKSVRTTKVNGSVEPRGGNAVNRPVCGCRVPLMITLSVYVAEGNRLVSETCVVKSAALSVAKGTSEIVSVPLTPVTRRMPSVGALVRRKTLAVVGVTAPVMGPWVNTIVTASGDGVTRRASVNATMPRARTKTPHDARLTAERSWTRSKSCRSSRRGTQRPRELTPGGAQR
jgi:hypothetical protein